MANRRTDRKETGCVYTPPNIVNEVLDTAGYILPHAICNR